MKEKINLDAKIREFIYSADGDTIKIEGLPLLAHIMTAYLRKGGFKTFLDLIDIELLKAFDKYEHFREDKKKHKGEFSIKINDITWCPDQDLIACAIYSKCFYEKKFEIEVELDELMEREVEIRALLFPQLFLKMGILDAIVFKEDNWDLHQKIELKVNKQFLEAVDKDPGLIGMTPKEMQDFLNTEIRDIK
jgi:hypothetical protein